MEQGYGLNEGLQIITLLLPFLLILILFLAVRAFWKARARRPGGHSEVSFVVDTFHELVTRLKDKEVELNELKRRAEEHAEEVESYSENIIQSVPSGVVSIDNDMRITKVNSAASDILRLSPEGIIGRGFDEVFHPPVSEMISRKTPLKRAEVLYSVSGHERLWIGLSISPLYDRRGESIGQILIFTDITELKTLERQMMLREWLSSLGEISLGIAHELRNPMAVISGYTKMLKKNAPSSAAEIDAIINEVSVMNRIIEDFLSFAKPVTPNRTDVDLKDMLEGIVDRLIDGSPDIEFIKEISGAVVTGDDVLLKQAFTNLIQNAVEAMPEGGHLTVKTMGENDFTVIEISNTGRYIPDEVRGKIFLPFYTTKEKGTGLGLAIVQKNITLCGGTVSLESSEGLTTFSVRLPAGN